MNWFKKIAQKEESLPDNEYQFSWDYELDEEVEAKIKEYVDSFVQDLRQDLLPKLNLFKNFQVGYVRLNGLATYINGTSSNPYIGIDVSNIKSACEEFDRDCFEELKISILHELGHAIQEYLDKSPNEDDAEYFAQEYNEFGDISDIIS